MLLIVGLGNPGPKHERQRHNVGFMAVDALHADGDFTPWKARFSALTSEGRIGVEKALLIKPTTFMNESGRAVGEAARFYKIELDDVIVLYDELDLAPGKLRVKKGAVLVATMAFAPSMLIWAKNTAACALALATPAIRTRLPAMCWAISPRLITHGLTRCWMNLPAMLICWRKAMTLVS